MITVLGLPGAGDPLLVAAYEASQCGARQPDRELRRRLGRRCDPRAWVSTSPSPLPGPTDARAQLQAITGAIALLATDPQAAASGAVVEVGRLLPVAARG